ncbi:MAG: NADH-quinone oxidoreductase subunit K [Nitrososphaeraceae archaeon]
MAAAEVAVGLAIIIIAYRLYKNIDVSQYKYLRG